MPLGMSWHDYNEALIERGACLMDFGFVSTWNREVESMNEGKEGRPYRFPESYVSFLAFLKVGFDMTYREVQGVTRALSEHIKPLEEMHFTHARRRIIRMVKRKKPADMVKVEDGEEPLTVVADSTGLSTTRKGSYIEAMWRKEKRKFVKLHILADPRTGKIVGFRVTSDKTSDTKKFVPMVKEVSKKGKVKKAYADAAYDARYNFNLLDELGIEPAIKVKRNSSAKPKGSPLRKEEVLLVRRLGYDRWKELKEYGRRWMVEVAFSAFKGVLGEGLRAKRFASQKVEASLKVMLYNAFLSIRP
jgi:transposase